MTFRKISSILFLFAALFISCKKGATDVLLQKIEQIKLEGDTNPEKALADLQAVELDVKLRESDYVHNKYILLQFRLRDKAFIMPTTSDSIEAVVDYFTKHGSVEEQMEAYYYEASVYRDLKDYPRAVTAFCKVLDLANQYQTKDSKLIQNTYSQLTSLYIYQQLYTEALKMAKAGCEMAERTLTLDPIYLMDVASAAYYAQDSVTHVDYCLKTLDYIRKDTKDVYPSVVCELLIRFSKMKMGSEANECYEVLHSSEHYKTVHNFLYAIALHYEYLEQIDSAVAYYKQILAKSAMKTLKMDASFKLMEYYKKMKRYETATIYATQYAFLVDSVFKEYQYESTSRASGEHLYAISLKKEMQAREEADRYKIRIYGMIAAFFAAALLAFLIYYKKREHYLKELLRKDEALGTAREVIVQKEDDLHAKEMQIRDIVRISLMEKASIDAADILQHFKDASEGKCEISVADWQNLYAAVEDMYPGFRETVMSMPRCTESYKNTAYLLKIGFNNAQIATLTGGARTTVWERVKRVKENLNSLLDS